METKVLTRQHIDARPAPALTENNKIKLVVSVLCSDDIYKNKKRNINNKLNIDENKIIDKIKKTNLKCAQYFLFKSKNTH